MPLGDPPSNFFVFPLPTFSMKTTGKERKREREIHCSYKFLRILLQSGAEETRRKLIETSVRILITSEL
jgi:hypothetical protein